MQSILLLGLMIAGAASTQDEGDQSCSQCGCGSRPKKVCRLKVGEGTITIFEYDVKCEDYCIPGHSKCCGYRRVPDQCGYRGFYKVPIWQACCGALKTRRYVERIPKTVKVPTYTCVVEKVCCKCGYCQVDKAATAEARAQEIMPVSFDEPIILDAGELPPHTTVDTDSATDAAAGQPAPQLMKE